MSLIGIDIGTQSTKGVLVDESGRVVATATAPHEVEFPAPGWAQQDSDEWLAACETVLGRLAREASSPVEVIGVSAQVDGVIATDADLVPLHPAVIWMDRRAAEIAADVESRLGTEAIYAITGLNCDASHTGPKMRWLLDRLETAPRYLMPPATVVTSWLTGDVFQDHANASSSMVYDISSRAWSEQMIEAFSLDVDLMPPIVESVDVVGTLRTELAERLGLDPSCRVVAGTGDDHAAAVGAGAVRPGVVVDITGTAEPIGTTGEGAALDPERLVEVHAHAVPGATFVENPGFVSGGSVMWVSRLLGIDQSEALERSARAVAGSRGLIFIPALSGSMAPRWDDLARGAFSGLTMEHGSDDMCRAVLEGCVFAARDIVDRLAAIGLPVDELRVTGGGARSPIWLQLKANILGRPVRPALGEGSAFGAVCLAAVAAGWYPDVPAVADALIESPNQVYEPDPEHADVYAQTYAGYRRLFDALEPTWHSA